MRHLMAHGCILRREGGKHGIFINPAVNLTTAVPRHAEINKFLSRKICRDLQVPEP